VRHGRRNSVPLAVVVAALLLCGLFVGVAHSHDLDESSHTCTACKLTSLPEEALRAADCELELQFSGRSWTAPELPISIEVAAPSRSRAPPVSH